MLKQPKVEEVEEVVVHKPKVPGRSEKETTFLITFPIENGYNY